MLTIKRLSLTDARLLIEGARNKQKRSAYHVHCVTDESGQLIAFERMDGGKSPARLSRKTRPILQRVQNGPAESYGCGEQPGSPAYGINSAIGGRLMVVAEACR